MFFKVYLLVANVAKNQDREDREDTHSNFTIENKVYKAKLKTVSKLSYLSYENKRITLSIFIIPNILFIITIRYIY